MEDLKASSREEALLAKIAGLDDPYAASIQPSSREEWFLNKIAEKTNSGGGGPLIATLVSVDGKTGLDKTAKEIHEAFQTSGVIVKSDYGEYGDAVYSVVLVIAMGGQVTIAAVSLDDVNFKPMFFVAATETDYPTEYVPT